MFVYIDMILERFFIDKTILGSFYALFHAYVVQFSVLTSRFMMNKGSYRTMGSMLIKYWITNSQNTTTQYYLQKLAMSGFPLVSKGPFYGVIV